MGAALLAGVYAIVLVSALATRLEAPSSEPDGRRPWATIVAVVLVGVPSLVQLLFAPGLLSLLQRDWPRIGHGQLWRLVTALLVQDGGLTGAVFNLVFLAVLGATAERLWSRRRWVLIALASGIGAELWGALVQPVGAGNSVVNFGLAASLAVVAVIGGQGRIRWLGVVSLVGGGALLVLGDLHGGAYAIGALLGAILVGRRRPEPPRGNARR